MSGLAFNPFNINVVEAVERAITSPQREVEFWKEFERRLDAVSKPGCPSRGFYRDLALKGVSACIATLPVPKDKSARDAVAAFLKENDDAAWLKYQLAAMGMPGTKKRIENDLTASVTGSRSVESTALLAARIKLVGAAIGNKEEKLAWGRELLEILSGHETFTIHKGKWTLQKPTHVPRPSFTWQARSSGRGRERQKSLQQLQNQLLTGLPSGYSVLLVRACGLRIGINPLVRACGPRKGVRPFCQGLWADVRRHGPADPAAGRPVASVRGSPRPDPGPYC